MRTQDPQNGIGTLAEMVAAQKRGEARGIYSVCSSNPYVLTAAMRMAAGRGAPLLVESTSNQVNQYGGYTGEKPADFHAGLSRRAHEAGLVPGQLILGGDHLGPNPWQKEPAETAMAKARELVAECVRTGYTKIHLDASMPLGGDPPGGPSVETAAERAAELCRAAESAWQVLGDGAPLPCYIVGTEVPLPGGEVGNTAEVRPTRADSARETLDLTRAAFHRVGLEGAWERVIGLVVQPGVEFGDRTIHPYQPEKATGLVQFIESVPGIVFEAHSTDYQTPQALRALVRDHFAILKVGPGLTFAFREAVFALEHIENELLSGPHADRRSHLTETLEAEMLAHPEHWQRYYPGAPEEQKLMRRFSLSDRIRYYWPRPAVQAALERLLDNLRGWDIPPGLVSQYFPEVEDLSGGAPGPEALIEGRIRKILEWYWQACWSV